MEKFDEKITEDNIILLMISSEEKWDAISEMAREILEKKEKDAREMKERRLG